MNKKKLYFLSLILALIYSSANAAKDDDHSNHNHEVKSKGTGDDENDHMKSKKKDSHTEHDDHKGEGGHKDHDDHKGKDDHTDHGDHKSEDAHEGHDDHKDEGGHDDHGSGKAVGKGKAIELVDEVKGFKLSKEAIKTLEIKLQTVDGDEFTIEKATLVTSKSAKGLYRFRGGFFNFLQLKLLKEVKGKYLVKVKGVDFGDQIVINGSGLLRVTDIYSTDKSEYGHSH